MAETVQDAGSAAGEDINIRVDGAAGRITLNRPKALNALTLPMCRAIRAALDRWAHDEAVKLVIIDAAGDRAFCAGGDIRALHASAVGKTDFAEIFWREEYLLNAAIKHYRKPYVSLIDGITMGGGVGLSAHGSHTVMSERTRFAMPETGIGFFPDVGGTYLLSHGVGEIGTYLALTGAVLSGADVIYGGGADFYVPAERMAALTAALCSHAYGVDLHGDVDAVLDEFVEDMGAASLGDRRDACTAMFGHDTMEAIVEALAASDDPWAVETHQTLATKSPTALKVTLRALRLSRGQSLNTCLNRELRMSCRFIAGHDFPEGIRAAVLDKDHAPAWVPQTLPAVTDDMVEAYFAPLGARELGLA